MRLYIIHLLSAKMIKEFQSGYQNTMPKRIRILHVDDEPADLVLTSLFLKSNGNFEISGVLSAKEALDKLESDDFDVIISDYKMPGMNGLKFFDAVRKGGKYADTPFIFFSGSEEAEDALSKVAERYITKIGNPASQCIELAHAICELVLVKGGEASAEPSPVLVVAE